MRTLIEVLRANAALADKAATFVRARGEERIVTFPSLWMEACRRAHALRGLGLEKGDRLALVLPEPDEFVLTFLGALTAGLVAVPVYPPQTLAKLEAYGDTLRHVLEASGAKVVVTSEPLRPLLAEHLVGESARLVVESDVRGERLPGDEPPGPVSLSDLAFLQFTSGSTSRPKGVMVTHGNLAANAHCIMVDGLRSTPEDRGVSWLPLYHDMGLIGFVVAPLFTEVEVVFLPTSAFIRRPSLWLDAIHRFRGTITFAPNFAFALATRAIAEHQAKDWDLSCLRALGCGAEPIQAEVLRSFLARFAKQGLRPESILPSYGMAEATLAVTFSPLEAELLTDRVDPRAMREGIAEPAASDGRESLEIVACGSPFPGHDLAIMSPSGERLGERQVGEIWLRGPSITAGYFGDAAATEETFGGGWLKTGDLAYVAGGQIFICGRAKDLIILNGKNYFPQDIEAVVSKVEGIRDGQCVAFSRLAPGGAEEAVVVAESSRRASASGDLPAQVIQAVRSETGVTLAEVVLIKRGTLPKTSSGKVKRRETKRRLELAELELLEAESERALRPGAPPEGKHEGKESPGMGLEPPGAMQ